MKESAMHAKIVEWSEDDKCFAGSAPGLVFGGCHGTDELTVFNQLCQVVEDAVAIYRRDGKTRPPSTAGRAFANKMQAIACAALEPLSGA